MSSKERGLGTRCGNVCSCIHVTHKATISHDKPQEMRREVSVPHHTVRPHEGGLKIIVRTESLSEYQQRVLFLFSGGVTVFEVVSLRGVELPKHDADMTDLEHRDA